MRSIAPLCLTLVFVLAFASCADDYATSKPAPTEETIVHTVTPGPSLTTASTASPSPSPTPSPAPLPTTQPPPAPTNPPRSQTQPLGFPIDPQKRLGLVSGAVGSRTIQWDSGPTAEAFSREDQPSSDPVRANRSGWNCRVHVEYEAQPAVDWYIPTGTPIHSTIDGTASLHAITLSNAFDYYVIDREPYLGNPDHPRAPVAVFPGPSGGKGIFVRVENGEFVTEYAHLDLPGTLRIVRPDAFLPGYSPNFDFVSAFSAMRDFRASTPIAEWQVSHGDTIGVSGDSGYSEAPHLHYTVRRAGSSSLLCRRPKPVLLTAAGCSIKGARRVASGDCLLRSSP